jgi:hypothetical protein
MQRQMTHYRSAKSRKRSLAFFNSSSRIQQYSRRSTISMRLGLSQQRNGRAFLDSINGCSELFTIAQMACDFVERKYSEAVQGIFVQFFRFFQAQPLQRNLTFAHNSDIPSVPVVMASNFATAMFGQFGGDDAVKDIIEGVRAIQVEERERDPFSIL